MLDAGVYAGRDATRVVPGQGRSNWDGGRDMRFRRGMENMELQEFGEFWFFRGWWACCWQWLQNAKRTIRAKMCTKCRLT